jgi:hypothetical protein
MKTDGHGLNKNQTKSFFNPCLYLCHLWLNFFSAFWRFVSHLFGAVIIVADESCLDWISREREDYRGAGVGRAAGEAVRGFG